MPRLESRVYIIWSLIDDFECGRALEGRICVNSLVQLKIIYHDFLLLEIIL